MTSQLLLKAIFFVFLSKSVVFSAEDQIETSKQLNSGGCEEIKVEACKDLPFYSTLLPNKFGHQNQALITLGVNQFLPVFKICNQDFQLFICNAYLPKCASPVGQSPCRSLCQLAKSNCEHVMEKFGLKWPSSLDCDQFPDSTSECIDNGILASSRENKELVATTEAPRKCEEITAPLCQDLSYNITVLPNSLGHKTQDDASLAISQFFPLIKVQCSLDLRLFLCSVYLPKCIKDAEAAPTCRSLCQSSYNGCNSLMGKFGSKWPDYLDCNRFPENATDCVLSDLPHLTESETTTTSTSTTLGNETQVQITTSTTTSTSTILGNEIKVPMTTSNYESTTIEVPSGGINLAEEEKCQEIIPGSICDNLDYNMTLFPNGLGHTNQSEAALEIHQWLPILHVNCSSDLRLLMCSVYFPKCVADGTVEPPCRSLCKSARASCEALMMKFGSPWPEQLDCDQFPDNTTDCLGSDRSDLTPSISIEIQESKTLDCHEISETFCDLHDNETSASNLLRRTNLNEPSEHLILLNSFIEANCSANLKEFLCQVNLQKCADNRMLPCRSVCLDIRKDCQNFVKEQNLIWPQDFDCDLLSNEGSQCQDVISSTVSSSV